MHTITLLPSGHRFACSAESTVLAAGLAAGFYLPYSCRSGVCNTCRGRVVEGELDVGAVHPAYLSEADKARGYAMLCQAKPKSDLVIELRELALQEALRSKSMPVRVLQAERLAPDVMKLVLGLPANEPLRFKAGQYIELEAGQGERRRYSMANAPSSEGNGQIELHVRHFPGGLFTDRVFGGLKVREILKIEAPLGTFFLREDSNRPVVMLAAGTGFAPIKALLEDAEQKGIRRATTFYWGGRRRPDLYMAEWAEQWAAAHPHVTFVPVLSAATPECGWSGRTGFVHRAVVEDFADLSGHEVYACGAPIVIDSARADFTRICGLPEDRFFADSFITAADRFRSTA